MSNTLVACGGTGAHVALALLRFHLLGYPLGFFRQGSGGQGDPLVLPRFYLVDQDSGSVESEERQTAWQRVGSLLAPEKHPGCDNWSETIGWPKLPDPQVIKPLPLGANEDWFNAPNDVVRMRFADSRYAELLMSEWQREIQFSLGMMGSPAVGSLLFSLKSFDLRSFDHRGMRSMRLNRAVNRDAEYQALIEETRGRVVVVGSGVGGTGASTGPTLAQQLDPGRVDAMVVMVLNWFYFGPEELSGDKRAKAQARNQMMVENANSALAYYGKDLARLVATVPVGVPQDAWVNRLYTTDNQQPTHEAYVHGVSALCALRHFLAPEPYKPGLYQMRGEDPRKLGGGTSIPGGTLQDLADQASTLLITLRTFAKVLCERSPDGLTHVTPALRDAVGKLTTAEGAGKELADLADSYGRHVAWMTNTLGIKPRPMPEEIDDYFTRESASRRRLGVKSIAREIDEKTDPKPNARALFHWTAAWVREYYRSEEALGLGLVPAKPSEAKGAYWPAQLAEGEGRGVDAGVNNAGELVEIPRANVGTTLKGFVDNAIVSQNGWPHPVAAPGHYRFKIDNGDAKAKRQLEILLVALVLGHLKLKVIDKPEDPEPVSLERLLSEYRSESNEHLHNLAAWQVVYEDNNEHVPMAFNAPATLFCPAPWSDGDRRAEAWAALWRQLTGSERPDKWITEEKSWNADAQQAVRQIQSWLVDLKSQRGGAAPAWTHIFQPLPRAHTEVFGTGEVMRVYWGQRTVEIPLPTGEIEVDEITDEELEKLCERIRTYDIYEMVEFVLPAPDASRTILLNGYWKGHLEALRRDGKISAFEARPQWNELLLHLPDRKCATLPNSRILDPEAMTVDECRPLEQDPIPGSGVREGAVLYPHLPLRSDYIELVLKVLRSSNDQRSLGQRGDEPPPSSLVYNLPSQLDGFGPAIQDGGSPHAAAVWHLLMKGCRKPIRFSVKIGDREKAPDRAHWMIWPRFRSADLDNCWRAYYVYEHCTNDALRVETLWLDQTRENEPIVRCSPRSVNGDGARPISFKAGNERRHDGGPPVALNLRDATRGDKEMGLYFIPLDRLKRAPTVEKVGIDFGTSHSVASATSTSGGAELVPLAPELNGNKTNDRITLHVSENWQHVAPSEDRARRQSLSVSGGWLPTYVESVDRETTGILPSELLTPVPLENARPQLSDWQPYRDYAIPFLGVQRANISDFVLSDFKWKVTKRGFRHQEPLLRRMYLGMMLELVMADIVRRKGDIPEQASLTFTYPLRTPTNSVARFVDTLRKVLVDASRSLGIQLDLTDDVGIFSESRAAKGGTNIPGEVSVVGDLGGGTLDIFISAQKLAGHDEFKEVADSASLGANLLLRTLAEHERMFLPSHNSWGGSVGQREMQLRMWMRAMGARSLFGMESSGNPPVMPGTRVQGFAKMADANSACALIDRYFRLIVDYISRSIVAYLARHWYPQVKKVQPDAADDLRLKVYLRGNGWRVWYGTDDYQAIQNTMIEWIEGRARSLWRTIQRSDPKVVDRDCPSDEYWSVGTDGDAVHHKDMPIRQALGQAESHENVVKSAYTHTLVDLFVHRKKDRPRRVAWHEGLPFEIRETGAQVVLTAVNPPLLLGDPRMEPPDVLASFEDQLLKEINVTLSEAKRDYRGYSAPVGPLVWEKAFESAQFIKKDGE